MNKILKLNSRDRDILASTSLLKDLSPTAFNKVVDDVAVSSYEAKDLIFREGDAPEYFYTVLTGFVRAYRLNREGREADIAVYGPGDTFAETGIFNNTAYDFNAQAAEAVTLARFETASVAKLVTSNPEVAMALMMTLSSNLKNALECVADDRLHTAPQRVANFILKNCPDAAESARFRLPFQKSLLAGKLGLAPEALSRAFSSLKAAGVSVRGRVIEIKDVNALRRF
ncbi:MAG: Crp/Fnr family transcriptional regulator [Gammaproteobacteria bacterium]